MQHVIRLGRKNYAIGLIWRAIADPRNKAEIKSLVAEQGGSNLGVLSQSADGMLTAIGIPERLSGISAGMHALATGVAWRISTGIYLAQLPEGGYWLCAVRDGIPVADGDFIAQGVDELKKHMESVWFQVGTQVDLYVSPELQGQFDTHETPIALEDITSGNKTHPVKQLHGVSAKHVVLVMAIGAVLVGGFGIKMYLDMKAAEAARLAVPDGAAEARKIMQEYMVALNGLIAPLIQEKKWAFEALPHAKQKYAVYSLGWTYQGFDCSARQQSCTNTYKGDGLVDIFGLAQHTGGKKGDVSISTDAKTATVQSSFKVTPKTLTEQDVRNLPMQAMLTREISQLLVILRYKHPDIAWTLPDPTSLPIVTASGKMPPNMPPAIRKGNIEITGKSSGAVTKIINAFEPLSVHPWHFVWSPIDGEKWKLEFSYVAK